MKKQRMVRAFYDHVARNFTLASIVISIVGSSYKDETFGFSRLFGRGGLTYEGIFQIMILAITYALLQTVFFSKFFIKEISHAKRMIGFTTSAFGSSTILVALWGWFPIDSSLAWIGFILSYSISLLLSILVFGAVFKSKEKEYERLLIKYQKKQEVNRDDD